MKTILTILALLVASACLAAEYTVVPMPTEANINELFFVDARTGYAVTEDGEVLITLDGGQKWEKQEVTKRAIKGVDFIGKQGYIVGDKGLLMRTTNGGYRWDDKSLDLKYNFVGVGMLSDTLTLICGNDQSSISKTRGVIFESWDRGQSWKRKRHYANGYTDMQVMPRREVWFVGSKRLAWSTSYGIDTRVTEYPGDKLAYGICMYNKQEGYLVGHDGYLARSFDRGVTWNEIPTTIDKDLYAVAASNDSTGFAVGEDGLIVYFTNLGQKTALENSGVKVDLLTVVITDSRVIAAGEKGTLVYREREGVDSGDED